MVMGFIGFGSMPPASSSSGEPDEESRGPDDTGMRVPLSTARAATSRYRRTGSPVGRYAWAISLGIHAIVLLGAYVAFRHYFRARAPSASIVDDGPGGTTGSVMQGADATDSVHARWGVTFLADGPRVDEAASDEQHLPAFIRGEPRTTQTLVDLLPASGIEAWRDRASAALAGPPAAARPDTGAATQPGGRAPIR